MDKKNLPRILAVDDSSITQKIFTFCFNFLDCPFDVADNAVQTLYLVNRKHYNLIFIDLGLPDTDGITLSETIRKLEAYQDIPIIGFSSHADEHIRQQCLDNGLNEFYEKAVLQNKIQDVVEKYFPQVKR